MIASLITFVVAFIASGMAIHNPRVLVMWQWGRARLSPSLCVGIAAALYGVVVGGMAILRHLSLGSNALDMGLMDQVVWNSAQGRWFEESFLTGHPASFLGHHFSPALALMVPFYWLLPRPETLLVMQILCIVGSALLFYRVAIKLTGQIWFAVVLMGMVLLHPLVHDAALFDFHQDAIGMFFLALGLFGITYQRWGIAAVGWLVSLLAKEEIAIYWMAIGLFFWVVAGRQRPRQSWVSIVFVLINALWLYWVIRWLIPAFQGEGEAGFSSFERYAFWGGSLAAAFGTLVSKPIESMQILLLPDRIGGLGMMLLPVLLFLVRSRWPVLLLLMPLGINSLADYVGQHNYRFHYSLLPIVIVVYACIWAVHLIQRAKHTQAERILSRATVFMGVASVMLYIGVSQIGLRFPLNVKNYLPNDHVQIGFRVMAMIPTDAATIAQNKLVAHLSQRREITLFSRQLAQPAEYYMFDLQSPTPPQTPESYLAEIRLLLANSD